MLFRNLSTSTIGWISRLMLEESVEYPHKYNNTGQASQSMIKQTAESILAQVNDTYIKIGDGNITLNGDTKVNGSLTLNDKKQGFLLVGNGGTTEISPNSIFQFHNGTIKTQLTLVQIQQYIDFNSIMVQLKPIDIYNGNLVFTEVSLRINVYFFAVKMSMYNESIFADLRQHLHLIFIVKG